MKCPPERFTPAHPITVLEDFRIFLLVGADHYWDIAEDQLICGRGPTADASKLGALLSGTLQTSSALSNTLVNLLQTLTSTKTTERDLKRCWSLESMGISLPSCAENQLNFLEEYINKVICNVINYFLKVTSNNFLK